MTDITGTYSADTDLDALKKQGDVIEECDCLTLTSAAPNSELRTRYPQPDPVVEGGWPA
jgi:hypothetical protein